MVSHPETGSDSPIGSDRDRGRDRIFCHTCMNLCLARLCLFDTLDIEVCLDFAYL